MRNRSAIEGDRNACRRVGSGDCDNEVENGIPDVDIGGLFDDKS